MPMIFNPTKETVSTKMQGSWFNFKPDTMKRMDEDKARFITEHRAETGLVILPAEFENEDGSYNTEFAASEEGKAILATKKAQGINSMLAYYKDIIRNNQVSLRKDMAAQHPGGDHNRLIALEMSDGEIKALELVARYQKDKSDDADKKLKDIQKLLDAVGPVGSGE